ncbi:DUF1800 domain-containing protein [Allorhizobium taibaishanense]|uniref:Uncharacterized protein (DUF1800 family) n=1 Tax=Allorhizobium taibaishanense TaxID=887144 RepID=A0A7W6MT17_9HYPH|nr:DUF1800 domain-containing protein [Allorhizobium taibaishanense]MBB4006603.1 uncharacterized protein (DUF1800 family) [Allorhizobium taibaishanense]
MSSFGPAFALDMGEARHLLQRTGFGASPGEMVAVAPLTREEAVDRLLVGLDRPDLPVPPPFVALPRPNYWAKGWEDQDMVLQRVAERDQMQVAWIGHMITTQTPFAERMALFWHGHFVSRFDPGRVSAPFFDQVALFRREGHGNFRTLLADVLRDPMMLTSLDNVRNTKSHPNENLARELMELFTLGIGHYDQRDVTEVARALAGHGVDFDGGWTYRYSPEEADDGEKHVLGQVIAARSGDNTDRLVDILLAQPQTAELIAAKFYAAFVSIRPSPEASERLAVVLRDHDYDLKPFLRALLLSPEFWSPDHRGDLVKSPIDLVVGFCRTFGLMPDDAAVLVGYLDRLGQAPFMAPSVAGWREGKAWLNMKTLAYRQTVLSRLWDGIEVADRKPKPDDLAVRFSAQFITTPTRFKVKVNGVEVGTVDQTIGLNLQNQRRKSETAELKPMWETAIIPAEGLPLPVRSVEVIHASGDPDSQLFVNWVEVDGRRYPPQLGRWSPANATCADAPKGMFYCDVGLAFDIVPFDPRQAVIDDLRADHNSHIEYTTARLALPALPHPRQSLEESLALLSVMAADGVESRETVASQWLLGRELTDRGGADRASGSNDGQRPASAQPVSMPMQPAVGAAADEGGAVLADRIRTMTLDPQYNLK